MCAAIVQCGVAEYGCDRLAEPATDPSGCVAVRIEGYSPIFRKAESIRMNEPRSLMPTVARSREIGRCGCKRNGDREIIGTGQRIICRLDFEPVFLI